MKKLFLLALVIFQTSAFAGEVFRIEIGKDYNNYSDQDLKRRVWELERAVYQLQQKVFQLEMGNANNSATWICKVRGMGETFSATGSSKAMAENAALEKCKASPRTANGFHCDSSAKCEQ